MQFTLIIDKRGYITTPGIDFGRTPAIHEVTKEIMVLKTEGSLVWAERGKQRYAPAAFYVCKILGHDVEDSKQKYKLDILVEFPIRKGSK